MAKPSFDLLTEREGFALMALTGCTALCGAVAGVAFLIAALG